MEKIRVIFDRRKHATRTSPGRVEVMITFSRNSRKYISTNVTCYLKEWKNGEFIGPNADKFATEISKEITRCRKTLAAMVLNDEPETLQVFNVYYEKFVNQDLPKNKDMSMESFLDFMEEEISGDPEMRDTTKRQYMVALDALRQFRGIRTFSDLTLQNIMLFDRYIRRSGRKKNQSTIHNYHKTIKKYVRTAYKLGFIKEDPYAGFEDRRGRTKERQALTMDELNLLRFAQLPQRYAKVRDVFVFQAFTGLAYSDLRRYKPYDTVVHGNMTYITGERYKTGVKYFTPMLAPAKEIYEKYEKKLPVISAEQYNLSLHHIEKILGLKKSLTSHVARHTFATAVTLANNVPIEVVSKMLGHTNIRTTQIYAKVMDSQIESSVTDNLLGKIK